MPKLIMLSGPSASGKSTLARQLLQEDSNLVRLNRDKIREMSILKWTPKREQWIIDAEMVMASAAAKSNRNILVDDTNLMPHDEERWKQVAQQLNYTFEKRALLVPLLTCVERDSQRVGAERIGRVAIERQFLRSGLIQWPEDKQVVIFDIDGTLADLTHRVDWIRVGANCPDCQGWGFTSHSGLPRACPSCEGQKKVVAKNYNEFYGRVLQDPPIDIVVKWAQACSPDFCILIVSGRSPERCADQTIAWLHMHQVPFDHIFMRRANNHGPDYEEKQLILSDILKTLPKEKIAFVVDDRPSVIKMWRKNGLRTIPVRGREDDQFYAQDPEDSTITVGI